jgi:hypothetical protein
MKLYEVIFSGSRGNPDAEDTIYLVRAPDFRAALEDVERNASSSDHNGERSPLAHAVYEMFMQANHALQRTRPSRSGCKRSLSRAGSLSLGR